MTRQTCRKCRHYELTGVRHREQPRQAYHVMGRCQWFRNKREERGPSFVIPAWMGDRQIVRPDRTLCEAWEDKQ